MAKLRQFSEILNECYDRIADGETAAHCCDIFPEHAAELQPLLEMVSTLDGIGQIKPDAAFKTRAHYEMSAALAAAWDAAPAPAGAASPITELAPVTVPAPELTPAPVVAPEATPDDGPARAPRGPRIPFWGQLFGGGGMRWTGVAASVVAVLVVIGGGTYFGSRDAMPDGSLYGVKLFAERTQISLTGNAAGRAELYTAFNNRRVDEISYLVRHGTTADVGETLALLDDLLVDAELVPLPGDDDGAVEQAAVPESSLAPAPAPATASMPTAAPSALKIAPTTELATSEPGESLPPTAAMLATDLETTTMMVPAAERAAAPPVPSQDSAEAPVVSFAAPTPGVGGGLPSNLTEEQIEVIDNLNRSRNQLIAELRNRLRTAPDAMKPLLEEAIQALEDGYRRAITNWALPQGDN